jgi:uncharacterized RDD family membrane protein YckC
MYTIIGGDGKEYGPVPADQVRAWVAAGRANMDTQVKELGTIEWRRLGDHPVFGPQPPPLEPAAHDVPAASLASRWQRLGAALVDTLLYLLCLMPIMKPMMVAASSGNSYSFSFSDMVDLANSPDLSTAARLPALVIVVLQVALLCVRGQTVGKLLFRIRIVRHRTGETARFVHAFLLRSLLVGLVTIIPVFGTVFGFVDACFIFRDDRRCLHDLIAGTCVVDLRPPHGAG